MLTEENGNSKNISDSTIMVSQLLTNASTQSFHELYALGPDGSLCLQEKLISAVCILPARAITVYA